MAGAAYLDHRLACAKSKNDTAVTLIEFNSLEVISQLCTTEGRLWVTSVARSSRRRRVDFCSYAEVPLRPQAGTRTHALEPGIRSFVRLIEVR